MRESIQIRSFQGNYQVDFYNNLNLLNETILEMSDPIIVIDRNVRKLYSKELVPILERYPVKVLDAVESTKTLSGISEISNFMRESKASKNSVLVAIGGGIIQDVCTFAAHVYFRGIKLLLVPTTLLSMCDSCIGAKCGINLENFKNQLGVFHSPVQVLVWSGFLNTLRDEDIRSGYGEILKLFLTGSEQDFSFLTELVSTTGLRNDSLDQLISRSLSIKKNVIEEDEYEKDLRRILNYGHTFGHAVESASNYQIPHGIAVAIGIQMANFVSLKKNLLSQGQYLQIGQFVRSFFTSHVAGELTTREILKHMRMDKKASKNSVNLVLLKKIGSLVIYSFDLGQELFDLIEEFWKNQDVVYWN